MKQLLKMEYYRLFRNKVTYIVLAVNLMIVSLQFVFESLPYWNTNEKIPGYPLTVFEKWIGGETASVFPTIYFLLVPLLSAIPYGGTLQEDIRSGYIKNICIRTRQREYFRVKYIVAFTTGIFSVLPLIFNFLLTSLVFPAMLPQACTGFYPINATSMLGDLFYLHPYAYLGVWLILDIVFWGLLATLSLAVFFLTNYMYVAMVTPFLACMVLYSITWISDYTMLAPFYFLQPCQPCAAQPGAIFAELLGLAVIGGFYEYRGQRWEIL